MEEILVLVPLELNLKAKHLNVDIRLDGITVAKKDGSKTYIDGEFPNKIDIEDSTWTLSTEEGQRYMEIVITKFKTDMLWWD